MYIFIIMAFLFFFFFNDTATTEIYTLSLHDALPIYSATPSRRRSGSRASPPRRPTSPSGKSSPSPSPGASRGCVTCSPPIPRCCGPTLSAGAPGTAVVTAAIGQLHAQANVTVAAPPAAAPTTPAPAPLQSSRPLASANVPVFDSPDAGNAAKQVGVLHLGGDTNWFVGQSYRSTFVSGALRNGWWAFTLSDKDSSGKSHWGWVPETYFKGGGNNEPDAGLFI